jgi:malate dehydrogenase (oxaloacetate-decarboxylating)(NADP+)
MMPLKSFTGNTPDYIVDGEMQANFAFNKTLRAKKFPFTKLQDKDVNTIIFPNLSSGNIAYKMMQEIGNAEVIGPDSDSDWQNQSTFFNLKVL